ncbi:hypothetical protein J1N35_011119 [Gossypium stocksii]|uniref:Aminotransferase-like plant mobile domain-containing protein n=1 Tax=Gossypium stocksii TaxID=47602 RepID=A0A9D3W1N0_9ROSI|nr:hypothetical protein J1N35_011119 [Gossypium stocksii]
MDASLIYFDYNHIFAAQLAMCTITLDGVALKLCLSVDRLVITGSAVVRGKVDLSMAILGKVSNRFKGAQISINWLEKIFDKLLDDSTEEVIQQYAQAFIMRLIGGILMLDNSRNLVHIRWLRHLMDFSECTKLSWGSSVLSTLYRELRRANQLDKMSISGCLLLL